MLRILATRCMMQAVYFASGTLQKNEFFHYGLACPLYTHFTSPIRRLYIKQSTCFSISSTLLINTLYIYFNVDMLI